MPLPEPEPEPEPVRLRSGDTVRIRALQPGDGPALAAAITRMSPQSRRQRFHSTVFELTDDMLALLTDVDHQDHEALAALDGTSGHIVADARFVRTAQRSDTAELAVAVVDSWQRRGLAAELLRRLADRAAEVGVQHFTATVLADNTPTVALLEQLGGAEFTRQGAALSVDV